MRLWGTSRPSATNMGVVEDLKFITRYDVFPVLAGEYTLRSIIERHYQQGNDQHLQDILKDMEGQGEDVEIVAEMEDEAATQAHRIEWHWVKGHSGNVGNERADALANRGIDELVSGGAARLR